MSEGPVFALPIGVDFPRELVAGLIARMGHEPPEAMARLRLYLNSGRMQRRVREEFDRHGARFLPRLGLISDLARLPRPGVPSAVPALRRRLELARLVAGLVAKLPQFEPGAGVFRLADSLADLLAEMQDEGVPPAALESLDIQDSHAVHWQASLNFIRIVAGYFTDEAEPDAVGRLRRIVEGLAEDWAIAPTNDRIVIAGSTGSRGTTAAFMRAVAALPNGMIVLPGFDFDMPDFAWEALDAGRMPIEDHPQYRYRTLLRKLGTAPDRVGCWTDTAPPAPARNGLMSLALRPAPVTDQWMTEGRVLRGLPDTCADLTLIEAPDERREALSLALILREAAENGRKAALITPNRMLTRRVSAALDRWGILPDDSAGAPLQLSAPGRLLRHVAKLRGQRLMIEPLLILLKQPLTATGCGMRGDHLRFSRELELHLRRNGPAFPDRAALSDPKWTKGEELRCLWSDWVADLLERFPLAATAPLPDCIATHLDLVARLVSGPGGSIGASGLWQQEAGVACRQIMDDLAAEADHGGQYGPADYADLLDTLFGAVQVRQAQAVHPDILILGTLEARVQTADLVLLAGLNEGSWPEAPAPDPWLSRRMRLDAGLLLPERQIGLSAHDFQQAAGAAQVVLSRSQRAEGAETVPSRWLNRLVNLLGGLKEGDGPQALADMRARGKAWVDMAIALEQPRNRVPPEGRPSPRPPAQARPRELPVTTIRTLIRDPYAVYARRILRLRPLDPLRPEPDPRLRGEVLHEIVETFLRDRPATETLPEAEARLLAIARRILDARIQWPSAQAIWYARIRRIAARFVADEAARLAAGIPVVIEQQGKVALTASAFTLSAKPDRIDILPDGSAHVYDYKSGKPPTDAEVLHFDKQLLLEAAMIGKGAFDRIGPRRVGAMTYIRLGGEGETRDLPMDQADIDVTWAKFERLIARYLDPRTGYTARRALQSVRDRSDYDHLSRFGEWEMSDLPDTPGGEVTE
ncbi:double-strand break repair protein AddB [Sinirhodobacter populi]|uniref:Double-strand break repair protein AddB n=1 Tax=Paenirhodobacter populi TaxID=2306993 RepID=A0A443KKP2_9RHOB|nr:double-strand break repair protein AddB [Sinirhodobacter populi]RWR33337.1 double-strand break repair protein AddB [Sinirhodobacter populi]